MMYTIMLIFGILFVGGGVAETIEDNKKYGKAKAPVEIIQKDRR